MLLLLSSVGLQLIPCCNSSSKISVSLCSAAKCDGNRPLIFFLTIFASYLSYQEISYKQNDLFKVRLDASSSEQVKWAEIITYQDFHYVFVII